MVYTSGQKEVGHLEVHRGSFDAKHCIVVRTVKFGSSHQNIVCVQKQLEQKVLFDTF